MTAKSPIKPRHYSTFRRVHARGRDLLRDPLTNKGTAFPPEERESLGLLGLLPPDRSTMEQQLDRCYANYCDYDDPLAKYVYLADLQDRNEVLFYRLLHEHIDEMMPIVYTPVVGQACQEFSHIYRRTRGLYVAWKHRGRIAQVLANWHGEEPSVIVVTDGERILGLGDQGAGGMGIPIGKLCLYTLCAGIPPDTTLPIMMDIGTDNEQRLNDPLYLGEKRKRIRGKEYQEFVDEFVQAVVEVYPNAILQWEDFLKENAIFQLNRFRDHLCTFNDDIQGTAAVTLAGLIASLRVTGQTWSDQRILIAGAGASAQGIASLIVSELKGEGISEEDARARISMVDRTGLVVAERDGLEGFKRDFARASAEQEGWKVQNRLAITLQEAVDNIHPTMLIGTSATPGIFTEQVVRSMGAHCERPVIFPLSNPTSQAECTPADALRWTEGRALLATGSPFDPVQENGRTHRIGQCNNSFIFPGVGLGAWVSRSKRITDEMFLASARALAQCVSDTDLADGALFPTLENIRGISHKVACAVIREAGEQGHVMPEELVNIEENVESAMWYPRYRPFIYEP